MKAWLTLQRAGGIAAILHAVAFLAAPVVLTITLVSLGLSRADMVDPAKALPAVARQYAGFATAGGMYVVIGATVLVLVLALDQHLREGALSLVRTATAAGLIASAFYVAVGMLNIAGLPELATHYSASHDQASSAYFAFQAVTDGLLSAASLAYGVWLVMATWAAIREKAFSRGLNYLGFACGLLAALAPFSADLAGVPNPTPIWAIWIGIVLLRSSASAVRGAQTVRSRAGRSTGVNGHVPAAPELPEASEA